MSRCMITSGVETFVMLPNNGFSARNIMSAKIQAVAYSTLDTSVGLYTKSNEM